MKEWKRSLRISLKYARSLLYGYPFFYAHQQTPHRSHLYPHLWCDSVTAIPNRGNLEIQENRVLNLQLATSKIHQLQLNSGQIFSFCNCVGDPTLSNGFKAGPVFVGGQVQTGVGGGLCLIATNLFHTFLVSGCQILERHCHSIDAYGNDRFYQLGQDASISYGYKDLIVRNHSAVALQLRLQVLPETGQVISSLWGQSPCPWEVKVDSMILQELSSPSTNISGWIVETRRSVCDQTDNSRARAGSKTMTEELLWQLDYRAISVYKPCTDSSLESTVKLDKII
ncbi:VanW family protein [Candidatus Synechococcus calcipolaris G9]|uniref:VanW family protein n=1 Tax=Candidatus Synechococcus calcipolaris G9 TaxID=1497997 RepID=A0ABT6F064_9SYNE|nr:VanW family protein [Candidatus Synechococcus calcipolaris]MDG2991214.1 VanW family protein [Candidatus Synechococcus calcipolaris G9]